MSERELRRALERGELRLHFQPVVRASTGRIVGAEALVRWQHPTRGLLGPAAFLDVAARSGLMGAIGDRVLREAIAQRATWPDGTFVSVNLSPAELASAGERDLLGHVARACEHAGVVPSDVWVEVTEQPILDAEATGATLRALGELGVRVVLDDFGSGHASLTRLRDLPFDVCKLDRSFVAGMAGVGGIRVVRAAVAMARAFGTEVVAEGVETAEQLEQLDALGCDLVQGYHLHRPMPAEDLHACFEAEATRHRRVGAAPTTPLGADRCGARDRQHHVLYHDDDEVLVGAVADGLVPALRAGDLGLTITTGEHRRGILAALVARGIDVEAVLASGQLVQFDAAATLAVITEDGVVVGQRLRELVAPLVPSDGRSVWAFGEMVASLWERGDVPGALALEEAWNELLEDRPVTLLCAYPPAAVAAPDQEAAFERIAQHHTHVVVGGRTWQLDADAVVHDPGRYVRELRSALAETALAVRAQARLEQELRELQQGIEASERFGAMVVHEIRNPASVLTLALDALRTEGQDLARDETEHLLDLAAHSARTISQLAAELLLAAKLEASDFALCREPLDLRATVLAVLARTRLATGRTIHAELPRTLPTAVGDDDRQRQILLNLLDNAVACSPPDAPVRVTCSVGATQLTVRVTDAGPGIAPADRRRLFEPFTQLEDSPRRSQGAGLGLHIVERLVRAQGGTIWIEDAPTGGAAFCYTVPRTAGDVDGRPGPPAVASGHGSPLDP